MSFLPALCTYPEDARLKESALPIDTFNGEVRDWIKTLHEARAVHQGLGLASPQLGKNWRCFVWRLSSKHPIREIINPTIVSQQGQQRLQEGCLSLPDQKVWTQRFQVVQLTGWDRQGKKVTHVLQGLEAACAQHELDHLNGILMMERSPS